MLCVAATPQRSGSCHIAGPSLRPTPNRQTIIPISTGICDPGRDSGFGTDIPIKMMVTNLPPSGVNNGSPVLVLQYGRLDCS
jgi:hypothetical protein